ncbi:MAG: DUF1161 domain-containing protein [Pseudomonadales bacterium]|jgi:hypothetical protein|nr:DUF1161 domain-containing protein [Pseudomonadales bacterium]
MKNAIAILSLCLVTAPVFAQKPCEELKSEIAEKLDAKGVQNYQLTIVTNAEADSSDQTVVGSCEGGTKKIIYTRQGR